MKRIAWVLIVAGLTGLSGCSDNNNLPAAAMPAGAASMDFTTFVSAQYNAAATTETAIPVPVEATNFTFADNDNPDAFNTIITTAP